MLPCQRALEHQPHGAAPAGVSTSLPAVARLTHEAQGWQMPRQREQAEHWPCSIARYSRCPAAARARHSLRRGGAQGPGSANIRPHADAGRDDYDGVAHERGVRDELVLAHGDESLLWMRRLIAFSLWCSAPAVEAVTGEDVAAHAPARDAFHEPHSLSVTSACRTRCPWRAVRRQCAGAPTYAPFAAARAAKQSRSMAVRIRGCTSTRQTSCDLCVA